jgi:hypothetical protein
MPMTTPEISNVELLAVAAAEVAEEPDTIIRRPEVIEALEALADQGDFVEALERITPGLIEDPQTWIRSLADALAPYREQPLDDDPSLVARLALVAWVLQSAARLESVYESAAVYA